MAETQAAKRLREYETIFLVKPDLTDDNVDKLKERVRGIVDREGGKVLRFTVWGKKKTMYPDRQAAPRHLRARPLPGRHRRWWPRSSATSATSTRSPATSP